METTITNDLRLKYLKQVDIKRSYFFSNQMSGVLLQKIAKQFDLDREHVYKVFAQTIGDLILGFYKIEDTVPLLQQELGLDPKTAALLGAEVLEFLAPLSDPNWQPPAEEFDGESEATSESQADLHSAESAVRRIPLKAPAAPQPLHTYAADLEAARTSPITTDATMYQNYSVTTPEPVYQPQTPLPTGQLSAVPTYTPTPAVPPPPPPPAPDRPRWSSEI